HHYLSVLPLTTMAVLFLGGSFLWAALRTVASLVNTRRLLQQSRGYAPGRHPKLDAVLARPDFRRVQLRLLDTTRLLAFTVGLWRPQIVLSERMISSLSDEELRAVLFHELGHVRSRDPLRLAVVRFLADALWFLPVARSLARDFVDAVEEGADDWAVGATRQPVDLAAALVKTAKADVSWAIPLASSLAGNVSVEDRVERLLGIRVKRRSSTTMHRWVSSGLISLLLFSLLMLPLDSGEAASRRAMQEAMMRMPMMACPVSMRQGR
ncbi:MAG: M56 family metallopeptidase, partial [Acidobacteriota bacterium]